MQWAPARADEPLAGIACRSVHLQYAASDAAVFYNEVKVERTAPGSFFMVCGFSRGYFGLQELADGKKLVIFSVWEPGDQNDPNEVTAERRVKTVYQGAKVRIGRFGNEGTGGQSFFDYEWKTGETNRCLVAAEFRNERTEYAAYFYLPEEKTWKHLATFSTLAEGDRLRGVYSFIEDFRRNRVSATQARSALFGPGWVRSADRRWAQLLQARFTADSNPAMNVNAAVAGERFYLATGGATSNTGAKIGERLSLPDNAAQEPPAIVRDALPLLGRAQPSPDRDSDGNEHGS